MEIDDINTDVMNLIQEVREEMKHSYHRFVELEMKMSKISKKLIDYEIEQKVKEDSPTP